MRGYVDLTVAAMSAFGAAIDRAQTYWLDSNPSTSTRTTRYCADDRRTTGRPPFIAFSALTYSSGRCQR